MKKNYIWALLGTLALASCSSEIGMDHSLHDHDDTGGNVVQNDTPIVVAPPQNVTPVSGEPFALGVVNEAVAVELNQSRTFQVSVTGASTLTQPATVNLSADMSNLDAAAISASFSPASLSIAAGESKTATVTVTTTTMATAFESILNGGQGKLQIVAAQSGGSFSKMAAQALSVKAILRVDLLTRAPHTWSVGATMNIKRQAQGTQIIIKNTTATTIGGFHVNPTTYHSNGTIAAGASHTFTIPSTLNAFGFYVHNDAQNNGNEEHRVTIVN